jgi:hypothetical protein
MHDFTIVVSFALKLSSSYHLQHQYKYCFDTTHYIITYIKFKTSLKIGLCNIRALIIFYVYWQRHFVYFSIYLLVLLIVSPCFAFVFQKFRNTLQHDIILLSYFTILHLYILSTFKLFLTIIITLMITKTC